MDNNSSNNVSTPHKNRKEKEVCLFLKYIKLVLDKRYKEKWILKTFWMLLLPFLTLGMLLFFSLIDTYNISGVFPDFLKSGNLFTISLTLITNVFKDQRDVARENKYLLKIVFFVSIFFAFFISITISRGFDSSIKKIILNDIKIVISILSYLFTAFLIVCLNFLNRTDDLTDVITMDTVDQMIKNSYYCQTELFDL